jgi:WXG100 family type VII secretion target
MAGEILVTPEELRSHSSAIRTQKADTETAFLSMRTRLEQLSTQFRGQAAAAFETRFNEWDGSARQLLEALDALGQFLEHAAETIEATDAQLAQGLQG